MSKKALKLSHEKSKAAPETSKKALMLSYEMSKAHPELSKKALKLSYKKSKANPEPCKKALKLSYEKYKKMSFLIIEFIRNRNRNHNLLQMLTFVTQCCHSCMNFGLGGDSGVCECAPISIVIEDDKSSPYAATGRRCPLTSLGHCCSNEASIHRASLVTRPAPCLHPNFVSSCRTCILFAS